MAELRRTTVSLTPPMLEDLRKEARDRDMTLSQLVRHYIRFGRQRDTSALDLQRDGSTNDNE